MVDKNIDAAQTLRKVYNPEKESYNYSKVNEPYNHISYSYNVCGLIDSIDYFYDDKAEKTQIIPVADVCSNLNGTYFSIFTGNDEIEYRPFFIVDCLISVPCNFCDVIYLPVNIKENDFAEVITQALKFSLDSTCAFVTEITENIKLTITSLSNGVTSNTNDSGATGFSFTTLENGNRSKVETINYTYDSTNKVKSITNASGDNILEADDIISSPVNPTIIAGVNSCNEIKRILVNPDGSLNVNACISSSPKSSINEYDEVNSVGTGIETSIVTYTVPAGKSADLQQVTASGTNIAEYVITVNCIILEKVRTYFGNSLNVLCIFTGNNNPGYKLNPLDTVEVKVIHNRSTTGDFNSRIQALEY